MWNTDACGGSLQFGWTSTSCTLQLQVYSDGTVNTVHSPDGNDNETEWGLSHGSTYRVRWESGLYPVVGDGCANSGALCEVYGETCLCEVEIETEPVYSNWSVPTVDQIRADLTIGAVSPDSYDDGVYEVLNVSTFTPTPGPTAVPDRRYSPLYMLGTKGMCIRKRSGELKLDYCWTQTLGRAFSPLPLSEEAAGPVWDESGVFLCTSANPYKPKVGDRLVLNETCNSGDWWLNGSTGALVHKATGLCANPPNVGADFPSSYEEYIVLNTSCAWDIQQKSDLYDPPGWKGQGFAFSSGITLQGVETNKNYDPPRWKIRLDSPCEQFRGCLSDASGTLYNVTVVNETGHAFPHALYYINNLAWPSGDNCDMYIRPYSPGMANFVSGKRGGSGTATAPPPPPQFCRALVAQRVHASLRVFTRPHAA